MEQLEIFQDNAEYDAYPIFRALREELTRMEETT